MLFDFVFYLNNEYQLKRVQFKTSLFIVKIMFEKYLCTCFTNEKFIYEQINFAFYFLLFMLMFLLFISI